jgi:hypothetical protein
MEIRIMKPVDNAAASKYTRVAAASNGPRQRSRVLKTDRGTSPWPGQPLLYSAKCSQLFLDATWSLIFVVREYHFNVTTVPPVRNDVTEECGESSTPLPFFEDAGDAASQIWTGCRPNVQRVSDSSSSWPQ